MEFAVGDRVEPPYPPEQVALARSGCLHLATILGDYLERDLVIVGGLVPRLLVDQSALPDGAEQHPGSRDVDVGMSIGILHGDRYRHLATRLRESGFGMDTNEDGRPTRQRWLLREDHGFRLTVDWLMPPGLPTDEPGQLRDIEADLAAVITPGLDLAFEDRLMIELSGRTLMDEQVRRLVPVCGPGAFVVLKALAFGNRGYNKDAFDLYYVVRNYGAGIAAVAERLTPLLGHPEAKRCLDILKDDFAAPDSMGPVRASLFAHPEDPEAFRADVSGFVSELVADCGR